MVQPIHHPRIHCATELPDAGYRACRHPYSGLCWGGLLVEWTDVLQVAAVCQVNCAHLRGCRRRGGCLSWVAIIGGPVMHGPVMGASLQGPWSSIGVGRSQVECRLQVPSLGARPLGSRTDHDRCITGIASAPRTMIGSITTTPWVISPWPVPSIRPVPPPWLVPPPWSVPSPRIIIGGAPSHAHVHPRIVPSTPAVPTHSHSPSRTVPSGLPTQLGAEPETTIVVIEGVVVGHVVEPTPNKNNTTTRGDGGHTDETGGRLRAMVQRPGPEGRSGRAQ
jgi:hypothetical protein